MAPIIDAYFPTIDERRVIPSRESILNDFAIFITSLFVKSSPNSSKAI